MSVPFIFNSALTQAGLCEFALVLADSGDSMGVLLQAGSSMMDPNHFLMIVLSRFELLHIFSSADIRRRHREANKVRTDSTVV